MPSTYTSNSGIELIDSGEQSGTWGDTTNTNLQIIDRLTNGVGSIALSGTTHTLTTSDGTLSDGHYKVLVFGGSPSGTNTVTVSPNDQDKLFFIKNNSGQSVIISQGSGANVTVPNGESAVIYCDGAGSGAAVVNLSATFDLTTFLTAANNLSDVASAATALTNLGLTATAAEINVLDGITADTAELNLLDGATLVVSDVTATAAELNVLDGFTGNLADLNLLDITTLGTSQASKVVTADANGDVKFSNAIVETVYALTGTALDPNNGTTQTKTISANTTFTDSLSSGESMSLHLTSASSYTITWPTITWVSGNGNAAPTLTAADTVVLFKINTTLYGVWIGSSA
jgi:hypothetical protein